MEYRYVKPGKSVSSYVERFWMLKSHSDADKNVIILPDGRVDLFFSRSSTEPFHTTLSGLETHPDQATLAAGTLIYAISFKLLAAEYILQTKISGLLDSAIHLPSGFWEFSESDMQDFEQFCQKAEKKIESLLPTKIEDRKQKLFDHLYSSGGELSVTELSEKVSWSSRQINRYFTQQFGLSLKAYCNILRFRASFGHIKEGKLFPENNFSDQSHFIKEVKKLAGVSPKELKQNKNDRFIQFSTLDPR